MNYYNFFASRQFKVRSVQSFCSTYALHPNDFWALRQVQRWPATIGGRDRKDASFVLVLRSSVCLRLPPLGLPPAMSHPTPTPSPLQPPLTFSPISVDFPTHLSSGRPWSLVPSPLVFNLNALAHTFPSGLSLASSPEPNGRVLHSHASPSSDHVIWILFCCTIDSYIYDPMRWLSYSA